MSNSFIIEYPKYPEYSKNETTEKQIQKNFLFNEEDDNDNVYSYYHKFSKKMAEYLNLTQNLDLSPEFYSITSLSYYAEIYEEENKLLIVSFNNKQDFHYYNGFKNQIKKRNNDLNISVYKNIILKNINKQLFIENFINNSLVSNLETKINRNFYREEGYLRKLCNKYDSIKSTILCENENLSNIFDNFFINNEIKMEIKPCEDLFLDNIKEILTKLAFPDYESKKSNQIILSNFSKLKYINNLYLLDILEYFNSILSDYNPINNINHRISNNNVINGILRKAKNIEKKNLNNKKQIESFSSIINNKLDDNELINEIQKELEDKEYMFNKKDNNNYYTHLFINNKKIGKENFKNVLKFLQKGYYKMFAWYINNEETLNYKINDVIKIVSTKENLTFYLNKKINIG